MRLKFLTSMANERQSFDPNSEHDWPDKADAERLIAAGYAVAVAESQTAGPGETAAVRTKPPGGK